jgi:hypothetical protein
MPSRKFRLIRAQSSLWTLLHILLMSLRRATTIQYMNPETLAAELNRDPFIPLEIRLVSGKALQIVNPGLCFIARLSLYVFAGRPNDSLAEDVQVVSLRAIESVQTIGPSPVAV